MQSWVLLAAVFAVWCLWALATAARRTVADARRMPEGQRGGVSIFPVIPMFPLMLWGCAWLLDRVVSPWGTWFIGSAHAVFAVAMGVSVVRDWRCLRSLDKRADRVAAADEPRE